MARSAKDPTTLNLTFLLKTAYIYLSDLAKEKMEFIEKVRDMDDDERDALWAEFSEFSNLLWVSRSFFSFDIE